MNRSRRLMIQLAAVGVATSGLASLRSASAATPAIGTLTEELTKLQNSLKGRTATCATTLAFANELRANRDDAIKRLMGPTFAPMLHELPLSTRTTVGNIVFDAVGNSSSPPLIPSPHECDELSDYLYDDMLLAGSFILDFWVNTSIPELPCYHWCKDSEEAMKEALARLKDAWDAYLACTHPNKASASKDSATLFPLSRYDTWKPADIDVDCRNANNQLQIALAAYRRAQEELAWCMENPQVVGSRRVSSLRTSRICGLPNITPR